MTAANEDHGGHLHGQAYGFEILAAKSALVSTALFRMVD